MIKVDVVISHRNFSVNVYIVMLTENQVDSLLKQHLSSV
jgi:hypothetical protein